MAGFVHCLTRKFRCCTRGTRTQLIFVIIVALAGLNFLFIRQHEVNRASAGMAEITETRERILPYNVIAAAEFASNQKQDKTDENTPTKMYLSERINNGSELFVPRNRHRTPDITDIGRIQLPNLSKGHLDKEALKSTTSRAKGGSRKKAENPRTMKSTTTVGGNALEPSVLDGNCLKLFLTSKNKSPYGRCKPHQASEESCVFAKELYFLDPNLRTCKKSRREDICSFITDSSSMSRIRCNRELCLKNSEPSSTIAVMTIEPTNGHIVTTKSFSLIEELEDELPSIFKKWVEDKFPFVFLKCRRKDNPDEIVTQLLPVRAHDVTIGQQLDKPRDAHALNVNILLLDSVSRAHFYRSLPETVQLFKSWSKSSNSPAQVFDFDLFQAVDGHTAENTHALFTGRFLPPYPEDNTPPVEMGYLFGRFARSGYQTMWQEDLCWKHHWGLMTDLAVGDWEGLQEGLHDNYIHQTGMTHSSCEILSEYGLESPFNGPAANQICYNGHFQHSYLLNYTLDTLRAIRTTAHARPLLSYMSLSVAHDDQGRRIQSLDPALTEYMKTVAADDNTITVLLADHGNTYTKYATEILEGRFEMFHPSLFIIVPRNVAKMLGKEAISALRTNQRRLTTVIDLHHALMALAGPITGRVRSSGIFGLIPDSRICDDVELRTPNLCVCDGWDSPTTNDTLKLVLVEFAIGELNNKIDKQILKSKSAKIAIPPLLRSCGRLQPVRFENVRERNSQFGSLVTSMDIYVRSADVTSRHAHMRDHVFRVEIESTDSPNCNSMDLRLLNYDRLTVFGKYKDCADPGVSLKLCICSKETSLKAKLTNSSRKSLLHFMTFRDCTSVLGASPLFNKVDDRGCLYIVKRNYSLQIFAYEIMNRCTDREFDIQWVSEDENIKYSRNLPFRTRVLPGSLTFGFAARKHIRYWKSSIEVTVEIIDPPR